MVTTFKLYGMKLGQWQKDVIYGMTFVGWPKITKDGINYKNDQNRLNTVWVTEKYPLWY